MAPNGSRRPTPAWLRTAQDHWTNRGQERPPFALEPSEGQESVWDYPRPPALVADSRTVRITALEDDALVVAVSTRAQRLLETASPPTFYLPPDDVVTDVLVPAAGSSFCEWKGPASYFALAAKPEQPVAWSYPNPMEPFAGLAGWVAFYPGRLCCTVDGERVRAQAGGFYGGWITDEVVGPFKGEPGTSGW